MPAVLLACLAALRALPAVAGAWVPAPGEGLMKVALLGQQAQQRWECGGATAPVDAAGGAYRELQAFAYAECGIAPRWALLGSWAWKDARVAGPPTYGTRSTTDLQLGARFAVASGSTPVAVQGLVSIPTYPESDLAVAPGARRQYLPAGSGRMEGELQVLAGRSLWPLPLYASAGVGYRARAGAFADAWLASVELGAASPQLFGKLEARWVLPSSDPCGARTAGAVAAAERALRLAPEGAVQVAGAVWLSAGVTIPVSGVNVLDAAQWSAGVLLWKRGG